VRSCITLHCLLFSSSLACISIPSACSSFCLSLTLPSLLPIRLPWFPSTLLSLEKRGASSRCCTCLLQLTSLVRFGFAGQSISGSDASCHAAQQARGVGLLMYLLHVWQRLVSLLQLSRLYLKTPSTSACYITCLPVWRLCLTMPAPLTFSYLPAWLPTSAAGAAAGISRPAMQPGTRWLFLLFHAGRGELWPAVGLRCVEELENRSFWALLRYPPPLCLQHGVGIRAVAAGLCYSALVKNACLRCCFLAFCKHGRTCC